MTMRGSRRLPGLCQRRRRCVRPQIPGVSPGGSGPHLTSSGFPCGLSSGFPFARRVLPLRPPSSGFPSSGVLRFGPFGRCSVPVPLRVPFPLRNPHVSAAAGRFRRRWSRAAGTNVTGSAGPPRRDRAIGPHYRRVAAGHDEMPPQNRLLPAAASAGHRRTRTANNLGWECALVLRSSADHTA